MTSQRRFLLVGVGAAACALVLAGALLLAALANGSPTVPAQVAPQRSIVWVGYPNEQTPHAIRISSLSVGAPLTDAFQVQYAGGNFTLQYQTNASMPPTISYGLTLRSLVEWNDTNGNGIIDNETILQSFPLGATAFGSIPIRHAQAAIPGGGVVHFFTITSNSGEITLNLTIAERLYPVSAEQTLTPMEAKLTVEVNHTLLFGGARLALDVGVETSSPPRFQETSWDDEHNFSAGDSEIEMTNTSGSSPSAVFFAWSTQASVNGRPEPVTLTGPVGDDSLSGYYDMYLAYPSAGDLLPGSVVHIVHDPVMGVVSASYASLPSHPANGGLQSDTILYGVSLTLVAGLVLASVIVVRRRRRTE